MDNETTVSAAYIFRGIEYIVTMCVKNENILTVEVEDKLTADQWRAEYESVYIEELTHKTGNFKQFNIFVSMLESGIIQASDSLSLDLLTHADLESLKQRKGGSAAKSTTAPQRTVSLNSKRYLILTYTVEFDRIHYPLPLPYVGKPDPTVLQEQVRNLHAEIKAMKQQGTSESKVKELEKLRKEIASIHKQKNDLESEFLQFRRELKNTVQGNALKELKMLKSMSQQLEEELLMEKAEHQKHVNKHVQEYRDLLEELEEIRASERNLKIRVKSLINELASYRRDKVHHTSRSSRPCFRERPSSLDRLSNRERSLSRDKEHSSSRERDHSHDRLLSVGNRSTERLSSANQSKYSDRSNSVRNSFVHRSRTPSPSPAGARNPRFDPSAYIKSKECQKKEVLLKRKRRQRSNMLGSSLTLNKPSPTARLINSRLSNDSHAEMSDGVMSDSSYVSYRNNRSRQSRLRSQTQQSNKSGMSSACLSSPDIPSKSEKKTIKSDKILASTPMDSEYGRMRLAWHMENLSANNSNESNYLNRSIEMSEIDERLTRLQQLMKTSMT